MPTYVLADPKYPGAVMDPAIGQYNVYWNVETEIRQRLTKAVTFRADLLLVFTQTGLRTQIQTKIQSLPFTVLPRASLRVLYFLYAPVPASDSVSNSRQRRRPNILVALMNNGFRDLENLSISGAELKVTENSEKGPPAAFRLDYVTADGHEAPTSFDVKVPSLRSGEVRRTALLFFKVCYTYLFRSSMLNTPCRRQPSERRNWTRFKPLFS